MVQNSRSPLEGSGREPAPRWVKIVLAVVAGVLLLLVLLMLLVPGEHGPGRHLSHAAAAPAGEHGIVMMHALRNTVAGGSPWAARGRGR